MHRRNSYNKCFLFKGYKGVFNNLAYESACKAARKNQCGKINQRESSEMPAKSSAFADSAIPNAAEIDLFSSEFAASTI